MAWLSLLVLAGIILFYVIRRKTRRRRQLRYIQHYRFHRAIREKLVQTYPFLDEQQTHLVFRALRDYFWMCNMAHRQLVAMPSQVVDVAWHEFILFTRVYHSFCKKALGRFLHHTPTEAMVSATVAREGIRRAWRLACAKAKIKPDTPARLPLIFEIDTLLNIPDGFRYTLNCQSADSAGRADPGYCASHIGCSGGCAGDSAASVEPGGFFDGLFDSSSGGIDCGGGCGGD